LLTLKSIALYRNDQVSEPDATKEKKQSDAPSYTLAARRLDAATGGYTALEAVLDSR
jgi:hypothetical protein